MCNLDRFPDPPTYGPQVDNPCRQQISDALPEWATKDMFAPDETEELRLTKRQKRIIAVYQRIEVAEPDISTERLLAMVEDETGADTSDVIDAFEAKKIAEGK